MYGDFDRNFAAPHLPTRDKEPTYKNLNPDAQPSSGRNICVEFPSGEIKWVLEVRGLGAFVMHGIPNVDPAYLTLGISTFTLDDIQFDHWGLVLRVQ